MQRLAGFHASLFLVLGPYAAALLGVLVAFEVRFAVHDFLPDTAVSLIFIPAVLLAAYAGGLWPALFATVAALPMIYYFVALSAPSPSSAGINLAMFFLVGGTVAVLGGILLGLIEAMGAGYIGTLTGGVLGSHYSDIFAFIVLIAVLTLKPSGLLGERVADRA